MIEKQKLAYLTNVAKEMRKNLLTMMGYGKVHHFGGSLSCVEIITSLYFYKMNLKPAQPDWIDRDRFIMSKGHSVPTQYVALAMSGYFPIEVLKTLKQLGSMLQGHPNAHLTPGIEGYTGSLGQGLSFGNGIAMAMKLQGRVNRTYVLMGDGELHEGQVWEAAMTTSTRKLSSLTAIIDCNTLKSQGRVSEPKSLEPLAEKWKSFNWNVITVDGHDIGQICDALDGAASSDEKPTVIIAKTVKGKGITFMEDQFQFHNSSITREQWEAAMIEIDRDEVER